MTNEFFGTVKENEKGQGVIQWDNPKAVMAQLMFLTDRRVMVIITDELKEMSGQQRKYYFGCLVRPLADGFGWSVDEMHTWLKNQFLSAIEMVKQPNGRIIETKKTHSLKIGKGVSTQTAEKFYTDIRMFGAEYGYTLRKPNEDELLYNNLDK